MSPKVDWMFSFFPSPTQATPSPQQLLLNVSSSGGSPSSVGAPSSASPSASSGSPAAGGEMITKLRREVELLKSKFLDSQRHWHEVSS